MVFLGHRHHVSRVERHEHGGGAGAGEVPAEEDQGSSSVLGSRGLLGILLAVFDFHCVLYNMRLSLFIVHPTVTVLLCRDSKGNIC